LGPHTLWQALGRGSSSEQCIRIELHPVCPSRLSPSSFRCEQTTSASYGFHLFRHELAQPRRPIPQVAHPVSIRTKLIVFFLLLNHSVMNSSWYRRYPHSLHRLCVTLSLLNTTRRSTKPLHSSGLGHLLPSTRRQERPPTTIFYPRHIFSCIFFRTASFYCFREKGPGSVLYLRVCSVDMIPPSPAVCNSLEYGWNEEGFC
jgi:hypothetical protein